MDEYHSDLIKKWYTACDLQYQDILYCMKYCSTLFRKTEEEIAEINDLSHVWKKLKEFHEKSTEEFED